VLREFFCVAGVGDAIATTSTSSPICLIEATWMSASNRDPMTPTFTFSATFVSGK
jgi:hypothetical protein